jgi:hypothetical protein
MEKPQPILKLTGEDGNAFFILGKAQKGAKQNNMNWEEIKAKATSGDYDNLLCVMMDYFDVR